MNGLIVIHKEKDYTSHDVVAKLRRILGTKKIGHGGTLDPEATGVLVIAVGKGTKLLEYIIEEQKVYQGEVVFGLSSDTEDLTGHLTEVSYEEGLLTDTKFKEALNSFSGQEIDQVPPMYSSVKVKGKKLYEYARAGKTIERESRRVTIFRLLPIGQLAFKEGHSYGTFEAEVSKGTYIRSLCVSIGETLGISSVMGNLKRLSVGGFSLDESYRLDQIEAMVKEGDTRFLLPYRRFIEQKMPVYEGSELILRKLLNGQTLENSEALPEGSLLAFAWQEEILSICSIVKDRISVVKNLGGSADEIF